MPFARTRINGVATAVAAVLALTPLRAFPNVPPGSAIENREMKAIGGGTHRLLGEAQANVFVFFRPDQEHSRRTMQALAELQQELAERSVHWVAVVSDHFSADEVRALAVEVDLRMPILVDEGDALYGELGVSLHPVVGIADQDRVLVAYQHFIKVNFIAVIRAQILHQLGEISDEELAAVRSPSRPQAAGQGEVARRNLRLARMLFEMGKVEKALERAQRSVELDPELAAGHALVGSILAGQGDCAAALVAFERALSLDPSEATALAGRQACQSEN